MTSETRGRNILATELLKDGYHERAERVAAGNEFMSDEPAVRACVEAVGGEAQGATAVGLLVEAAARFREYEAHHRARVAREAHNARYDIPGTAKGGSLEKAERNAEIAGRIEAALALPSPVRQGEDEEEGDPGVMNLRAPEVDKLLADLDQAIEEGAGHLALESVRIVRLMRAEHRRLAALSPVRESVLEEAARIAERYDWRDEPETRGYAFWNPDTGYEWSRNHPVKSGEAPDVSKITRMTYRKFREQSVPFAIAAAIRALKSDPDFTGHIDCPEDEGGSDHGRR